MQPQGVLTRAQQVIHDYPGIFCDAPDHPPMRYSQMTVAVMLTFKTIWPAGAGIGRIPAEGSAGRLRPIQPQKAAGATHLIFTIDDHSIVNGRPRESVV